MEYLKVALPAFGTIVVAILAYLFNKRAERRSRAEQYQLEQIDALLRNIIENARVHQSSDDPEEKRRVSIESDKALAVIPVYGSPKVRRICDALPTKEQASHEQVTGLVAALQEQGRDLLHTKKWFTLW